MSPRGRQRILPNSLRFNVRRYLFRPWVDLGLWSGYIWFVYSQLSFNKNVFNPWIHGGPESVEPRLDEQMTFGYLTPESRLRRQMNSS